MWHFHEPAIDDTQQRRWDMPACFIVASLLVVAGCGLFFDKLWSRILTGLMMVVGCSGTLGFILLLGRGHHLYAFALGSLLVMCIYTELLVLRILEKAPWA
jgi:hypothetical protein